MPLAGDDLLIALEVDHVVQPTGGGPLLFIVRHSIDCKRCRFVSHRQPTEL